MMRPIVFSLLSNTFYNEVAQAPPDVVPFNTNVSVAAVWLTEKRLPRQMEIISRSAVVATPRVESRSNSFRSLVVHGYKSHHQLPEHPQPPLLHQIDGEMEGKSMASSSQKEPALSCLGV